MTPIFHQLIATQYKIDLPVCILNIGGISNVTIIDETKGPSGLTSSDIGPGNCMIDTWVRKNSKQSFDKDGILASKGIRNEIIYEQGQELFSNRPNQNVSSFDINEDGSSSDPIFFQKVINPQKDRLSPWNLR